MRQSGESLLNSLKNVRWDVAANTYGNNHATLIGLLVEWWISSEPETHRAVEAGPSFGHCEKGVGGGRCDAIFCEKDDAIGVLEVEGTRYELTIQKIGKFLPSSREDASSLDDMKTLRFAIAVLYATGPRKGGAERAMPSCWNAEISSTVTKVSHEYPDKPIVVVALDKVYERHVKGIRRRHVVYKSKLTKVWGFVYEAGERVASNVLWDGNAAGRK
ncbi:MAG: hypothetical protein NTX40_01105 [Planctomycetota bacterium]|nr:hypothetical protein [Planctomycetota bacterium]